MGRLMEGPEVRQFRNSDYEVTDKHFPNMKQSMKNKQYYLPYSFQFQEMDCIDDDKTDQALENIIGICTTNYTEITRMMHFVRVR